MVAVLVRLKLALLRHSFKRDGAAVVGLALAGIIGAALVVFAVIGLVSARSMRTADAGALVVPALSTLTLGWLLGPIVLFGSDETLDAGRFALLPLDATRLRPGLALSALIGVPGVALVIVSLAQIITWTRSPGAIAVACLSAVLGAATCVLLTRVVTSAFSRALASRRMRDVAAIFLGIFAATAGVLNQLIGRLAAGVGGARDASRSSALHTTATITGWSPFGWAWSAPVDAAGGRPLFAAAKILLSLALIAALWWAWGRSLDRALVSPLTVEGGGEVSSRQRLPRIFGASPTGAVLGRCLRYWRRDPRYLAALASFVVIPLVLSFSWAGKGQAIFAAPIFFVAMAFTTLMSDLAYDNSAFWVHVSTGVSMRADRWGRFLALALIVVPTALVVAVALGLATGHVDGVVWSIALTISVAGSGGGLALAFGSYQPGQAPPPGTTSFRRGAGGSGGGLLIALALLGCWVGAAVLSVPVILLVLFGQPWIALVVAPFIAAGALVVCVRLGASQLERTLPEILLRVTR